MKHSDTKRVVLTLRDILRDKLRIVNSRKSALCSLGHAAWHQTATTRPLTSAITLEERKRGLDDAAHQYTFHPHFRPTGLHG